MRHDFWDAEGHERNVFVRKIAQDNDIDGFEMTLNVGKLGAFRRLVLLREAQRHISFLLPGHGNGVQETQDMDEGCDLRLVFWFDYILVHVDPTFWCD